MSSFVVSRHSNSRSVNGKIISIMEMEQVLDEYNLVEFECGDDELNDFIINDALDYHRNLLSESYLLKDEGRVIAYVTILNDSLDIDSFDDRTSFNRFRKKHFVNSKRLKSYPALKIGRLAVCHNLARKGYGSVLLDFVKLLTLLRRFAGCRFMTVDAYNDAVPFYEKNGFVVIRSRVPDSETILMCYDLVSVTP